MKIVEKSYNVSAPEYLEYSHYKHILEDFKERLLKNGVKRTDYKDLDFDGAEGIMIKINGVTNPKAWEILEENYGLEPDLVLDDKGNEYNPEELKDQREEYFTNSFGIRMKRQIAK
tara:strand:- start:596 stop:943 length:348 start_codon:yes stop_codon:yes gene_type:complete